MTPLQLEAATAAFCRMLRREFDRRKPQGPNPVPPYEEMRGIDKMSFMRCVQAAVQAAKQNETA